MSRRDTSTLDLFRDYTPKQAVARYDEALVRAATLSGRVSRAVANCLNRSPASRPEIAKAMSTFLGEDVPVSMLNSYASQGKEKHQITATRLLALAVVTGQEEELLNALLNAAGLIAVPQRYETLIRRELALEQREKLDREIAAANTEWERRR